MTKKKRIIRFITYYRMLRVKPRGELRKLISDTCEYKGGTFDYKMNNQNYSELEINAIEKVIEDYKNKEDGKIKVL